MRAQNLANRAVLSMIASLVLVFGFSNCAEAQLDFDKIGIFQIARSATVAAESKVVPRPNSSAESSSKLNVTLYKMLDFMGFEMDPFAWLR